MKKNQIALLLTLSMTSLPAIAATQVTQYAEDSGYSACLSTVADIESFFAKDSNYGSWAFLAKEGSDDQILNATLELTYNDGSMLVDFTVTPAKDGTCSYSYTRTWYSEKNCLATSRENYMKEASYKTEINKNIMGFEDTSGAKLLLMPAGSGCMVQKKEVGFRHKKQGT